MKMKRILSIGIILLLLLGLGASVVSAQTYRFQVQRSTADIYVNADGTVQVEYTYVFVNDPSADPIDFVDVGMPNNNYSLSNVSAEINGAAISSIEESPYVKPGVALGLGSQKIAPGSKGTVHVTVTGITSLVYKTNKVQDVQEPYASFEFSPNSFGSDFVRGSTDMTVTLHLPPGIQPEEPRWFTPQSWPGGEQPISGIDEQNSVFYRWQAANASSSTQYIFGGAFPARLVPADALVTEPVVNISSSSFDALCPWVFCFGFFGFMGLIIYGSVTADRKRRMQYLPPKISLEGNGIKRGLTAVEAAVLMEQPLDKILSMILFGAVKKGGATVVTKEPLKIERLPQPTTALYEYETAFLNAMTMSSKAETRKGLQDMMVGLVKSISEKMRGFSRKETIAYYQEIMKRAWDQMTAAGTPEVQMKAFDEAMEWTMLDSKYEDRSRQVYGPRTIFVPMWWGRYDPGFGRGAASVSSPSIPTQVGSAPGSSSLPSLPGANVAASVVSGIQNFSSNVVGDISNFTSGVTNATNPVPKPTTSSGSGRSGGGGGRSCACACACAGCACACAGGGR
jgi:hypothetical protein